MIACNLNAISLREHSAQLLLWFGLTTLIILVFNSRRRRFDMWHDRLLPNRPPYVVFYDVRDTDHWKGSTCAHAPGTRMQTNMAPELACEHSEAVNQIFYHSLCGSSLDSKFKQTTTNCWNIPCKLNPLRSISLLTFTHLTILFSTLMRRVSPMGYVYGWVCAHVPMCVHTTHFKKEQACGMLMRRLLRFIVGIHFTSIFLVIHRCLEKQKWWRAWGNGWWWVQILSGSATLLVYAAVCQQCDIKEIAEMVKRSVED